MNDPTPQELLKDFDKAIKGRADIDPYTVLWGIIEDVMDSVSLATAHAAQSKALDNPIERHDQQVIQDIIMNTVWGYIINHYEAPNDNS